MDPKKLEMIEEILEHLSGHQARALKELLDKSRAPKEMAIPGGKESAREEDMDMPKEMGIEVDVVKPKEEPFDKKVDDSIEGNMDKKPEMGGDHDEMTDEELSELLKKIC